MDDDNDMPAFVPVRPYSAEHTPAAEENRARSSETGRRSFRPTLPSSSRPVEPHKMYSHQQLPMEETAGALLQNAWRRREVEGRKAGFVPNNTPERFQGMSLQKFGINVAGQASGGSGGIGFAGPIDDQSLPPRQQKERREGHSMELMDLAFTGSHRLVDGQLKSNYAPISLPYFQVSEEQEGSSRPEVASSGAEDNKKHRPKLMHIDELNANAAKQLFLNEDGVMQEDKLFLVQLPAVLPELVDPLEEVQRETEDAATAGAGASITRFPDGQIGKLRIHKSGKVRMEIGGVPFCVDQGCETFFQQDLACVCPLREEIIDLGPVRKRIVLTPDIDAICRAEASAAAAPASVPVAPAGMGRRKGAADAEKSPRIAAQKSPRATEKTPPGETSEAGLSEQSAAQSPGQPLAQGAQTSDGSNSGS